MSDVTVERVDGGVRVFVPDAAREHETARTSGDALRAMLKASGTSGRQLSAELGKSPGYVGSLLNQGGDFGTENLARMARAMGYALVLRGDGHEVEVAPD